MTAAPLIGLLTETQRMIEWLKARVEWQQRPLWPLAEAAKEAKERAAKGRRRRRRP